VANIELIHPSWSPGGLRPETAGLPAKRIEPRVPLYWRRLAQASGLAATGALTALAYPALLGESMRFAATFAASTILLSSAGLMLNCEPAPQNLKNRSLIRELSCAAFATAAPFALVALLTLAAAGNDAGIRLPLLLAWLLRWGCSALLLALFITAAAHLLMQRWAAAGKFKRTVAIVGSGPLADQLLNALNGRCGDEIEIIGVFDDRASERDRHHTSSELRRGTLSDLLALAKRADITDVIIALPNAAERRLLDIVARLKQLAATISLAPDALQVVAANRRNRGLAALSLIEICGPPLSFGQALVKNVLDRLLAALALIPALPLMAAIAIAIKLDSRGPVLFRQRRLGAGNRIIQVYKFRTMRPELCDFGGARQAGRDDDRVTAIGRILRRTRLDELPQLLDVLRGDLSLVGPRPLPLQMLVEGRLNHEIAPEYHWRHRVKPGLTGLAQIQGSVGPVETAEELRNRIAYDLEYIDGWSLLLDFKILSLTLKAIVRAPAS